jgi:uncharacterized membrane protein YhaH (DUF805 family)
MDWTYLFTSLEGRINRRPFWIGLLVLLLVSFVLQFAVMAIAGQTVALIVSLFLLYPNYALSVKRFHDRNRPDWILMAFYALLVAMILMQLAGIDMEGGEPTTPFIIVGSVFLIGAIWLTIELGFLRGTQGPNDFGHDPLEGQA